MIDSFFLRWARDNKMDPDRFALTVYFQSGEWQEDFEAWKRDRLSKEMFVREQVFSQMDHEFFTAMAEESLQAQEDLKRVKKAKGLT